MYKHYFIMQNGSAFSALSKFTPGEIQDKMKSEFFFISDNESGDMLTIATKNIVIVRSKIIRESDPQ